MPPGDAPRLLFYSHNGVGIGHVQRQVKIASAYRRRRPGAAVLVVTGSHAAGTLRFPAGVDYLKLPSIRMVDRYETWEPRDLSLTRKEVMRLRSDLIRQAVRRFRPDVLVADFMPAGPYGELLPALEELSAAGGRAVAGFRDIVDEPGFVRSLWKRTGVYEVLNEHYSAVCVYGSQRVLDFARDYGLHAPALRYVGYLATPPRSHPVADAEDRLVLATTGGGVDGWPLLDAFVAAARRLGGRRVALAGPLLSDGEFAELGRRASGTVEFRRTLPDFERLLAGAGAMVAMAGYNTCCHLLSHPVRAVVVPRDGPSLEQRLRAEWLAGWGRVEALEPGALTPDALGAALERALEAPAPPAPPVPLGGVDRALDLFEEVAASAPLPAELV